MFWTLKEAQHQTNLPYSYLRSLCVNNQVRYVRSGTKYYVYSDSLIKFLIGEADEASTSQMEPVFLKGAEHSDIQ